MLRDHTIEIRTEIGQSLSPLKSLYENYHILFADHTIVQLLAYPANRWLIQRKKRQTAYSRFQVSVVESIYVAPLQGQVCVCETR